VIPILSKRLPLITMIVRLFPESLRTGLWQGWVTPRATGPTRDTRAPVGYGGPVALQYQPCSFTTSVASEHGGYWRFTPLLRIDSPCTHLLEPLQQQESTVRSLARPGWQRQCPACLLRVLLPWGYTDPVRVEQDQDEPATRAAAAAYLPPPKRGAAAVFVTLEHLHTFGFWPPTRQASYYLPGMVPSFCPSIRRKYCKPALFRGVGLWYTR
jgi:hypothetical protein